MRVWPLGLVVVMLGCGKASAPSSTASVSTASKDPLVMLRENDAQAAFNVDAACASIEEAFLASKKLADTLKGDQKETLLDVVDMLDSSGATLAQEHEEPPALEAYRTKSAAIDKERKEGLAAVLDALQELHDAEGILEGLSEAARGEAKTNLEAILTSLGEAIDAVETAVPQLGGKVPADEEDNQSSSTGS